MKCTNEKCPGNLRQRHTYTEGHLRFTDRICTKCKRQHTFVTQMHKGDESAYELAKKERGGKAPPP